MAKFQVGGPYYLTSAAIDCSQYSQVALRFASWLNMDDSMYTKAGIEISTDGETWDIVWQNTGRAAIEQNYWDFLTHDISEYADGKETVYIRWSYEIMDYAYPYSGWNIDDIQFIGIPK